MSDTVYIVNSKTNAVERWTMIGEYNTVKNGKLRNRLCYLSNGKRFLALPRKRVFDTREAARAASKK